MTTLELPWVLTYWTPIPAIVSAWHPYRKVIASTLDLLKNMSIPSVRHTWICLDSSPGGMGTAYPINVKELVMTKAIL
jgi:hypothetical protein